MATYTTDDLITQVRTGAYLPSAGGLTDAEILRFINEERRTTMAEAIRRAAPSFWRTSVDFTISTGQDVYRIPDRALMSGIESAVFVDGDNHQQLNELDDEERFKFSAGARDPYWRGQFAYIIEAEHIRLVPTPESNYNGKVLRVYYTRQMSDMVLTARAIPITSASTTTRLVVGSPGSDTASLQAAGTYVDVVRGAGMFGPIAVDRIVSAYGAPNLDLNAGTPIVVADVATYAVGSRRDYVCLAGETVYTELPLDMWPFLVQAAVACCFRATKDFEAAQMARGELAERMGAAKFLAEPRSREQDVIMNHDSVLRRGRRR